LHPESDVWSFAACILDLCGLEVTPNDGNGDDALRMWVLEKFPWISDMLHEKPTDRAVPEFDVIFPQFVGQTEEQLADELCIGHSVIVDFAARRSPIGMDAFEAKAEEAQKAFRAHSIGDNIRVHLLGQDVSSRTIRLTGLFVF
jgi:hypothetical protein